MDSGDGRKLAEIITEAEFLGQNPDKSFKSFPPCYLVTSTALP
jgi:hypothetical protein